MEYEPVQISALANGLVAVVASASESALATGLVFAEPSHIATAAEAAAFADRLAAGIAAIAEPALTPGLVLAEPSHIAATTEAAAFANTLASITATAAKSAFASGFVVAGATADSELSAGLGRSQWRLIRISWARTCNRHLITLRANRGARRRWPRLWLRRSMPMLLLRR